MSRGESGEGGVVERFRGREAHWGRPAERDKGPDPRERALSEGAGGEATPKRAVWRHAVLEVGKSRGEVGGGRGEPGGGNGPAAARTEEFGSSAADVGRGGPAGGGVLE